MLISRELMRKEAELRAAVRTPRGDQLFRESRQYGRVKYRKDEDARELVTESSMAQ